MKKYIIIAIKIICFIFVYVSTLWVLQNTHLGVIIKYYIGEDLSTQYIVPIIPSVIAGLILMWITPTPMERIVSPLEKANKEEDPHEKLSYVKDSLAQIESYYLKDFERDRSIIESLLKSIDVAKDIEEKYKEEEIIILAQTCIKRAEQGIQDIRNNYSKEFENEAQLHLDKALAEKTPTKALDILTNAIRIYPTAQLYYNRGLLYYNRNDNKSAIEDYNEAILLKPNFAEAFNSRGNSMKELGKNEDAIQDYNTAILFKPDLALAFNNRGVVKHNMGFCNDAIKDYTEAIRLMANYAEAFCNRGFAKFELGDIEGAIQDYNEAIRINPTFDLAFMNLGILKYKGFKFEDAIKDFSEAIRLNCDNNEAYRWKYKCLRTMADKESDANRKSELLAKAEEIERHSKMRRLNRHKKI